MKGDVKTLIRQRINQIEYESAHFNKRNNVMERMACDRAIHELEKLLDRLE